MSAGVAPEPGAIACPRCGAHIASGQDWCLHCGDAARTRLVPTPNWRLPVGLVALVATLGTIAIAVAVVELTRDAAPAARSTTAPPPAATTAPPATIAPPAGSTATTPSATTTTPTTPSATTTTPTTPGARTTPTTR